MAKAVLNPETLLILEQPFVKVPYEQMRKTFRTSQRILEKEMANLTSTSSDLAKRSLTGSTNPEEICKALDGMLERLNKLKRKLEETKAEERTYTSRSRARLEHLNDLMGMKSYEEPEYARWSRTRLNRILVDYMLREGLMGTATKMSTNLGLQDYVDIEVFAQAQRVEQALRNHSCSEALQWCAENKSTLRKNKSALDFQLRLQEYIELVRKEKLTEAIAYSKKNLVPWADTHMKEIQQSMGLLAFKPNTKCKIYMKLFDPSRWTSLIQQFRADNYSLNSLPSQSLLTITLQAGLSALKTPQCYQTANRNFNCPVCAADTLGVLAEKLPLSHHVNSTIVCRISGEIMNEDNPPMVLPNGMVYSYKALTEMASTSENIITCPRTGATCDVLQLKKVFIS